jgi:PIN domain nuclease of toxin-antitoxin system
VRLLLDTPVVLWWLSEDPVLKDDTKKLIKDTPDVYLSVATTWELAIKQKIGKLTGPDDLLERVQGAGFTHLAISFQHAVTAGRLPLIHRDPFDRMFVAQARCEGLTLVTHDSDIQKYEVDMLAI